MKHCCLAIRQIQTLVKLMISKLQFNGVYLVAELYSVHGLQPGRIRSFQSAFESSVFLDCEGAGCDVGAAGWIVTWRADRVLM